jgi:hypothetical protein
VGNPWTKAAYQELYRLRRASDVVTAILDGNTHRSIDDWQRARALLSGISDERPISGSLTPASTSEATEHQAAARRTPEMEVPVTLSIETGEAEASLAKLCASIEALTAQAERLAAVSPLRVGGTTTVTNVASQDPEAAYRTIKDILNDAKMKRLTAPQAASVLRTVVGMDPASIERFLLPLAESSKAPVDRKDVLTDGGIGNLAQKHGIDLVTPEQWATKGYPTPSEFKEDEEEWHAKPIPDQRGFWWFKMTNGCMSDMSTEEELRAFILGDGRHLSNEAPEVVIGEPGRDRISVKRSSKSVGGIVIRLYSRDGGIGGIALTRDEAERFLKAAQGALA